MQLGLILEPRRHGLNQSSMSRDTTLTPFTSIFNFSCSCSMPLVDVHILRKVGRYTHVLYLIAELSPRMWTCHHCHHCHCCMGSHFNGLEFP